MTWYEVILFLGPRAKEAQLQLFVQVPEALPKLQRAALVASCSEEKLQLTFLLKRLKLLLRALSFCLSLDLAYAGDADSRLYIAAVGQLILQVKATCLHYSS